MSDQLINIITKGVDEASSVLSTVGGGLSSLGGIAAGVATGGLALAGAAIAGMAVGAGLAAKAVFDFSQDTNNAMKLFGAQTGFAGEELDAFKETAKDVWAEGFGDNIEEVISDMSLVQRAFGETGEELEASTKRAITMADVFDLDVAEGVAIASSVMDSFNISSEEAFDVMVRGSQLGLDKMGDLNDTLNEYSSDFDRLGFTAEQTLGILNAGLEEGAFNTDVVADGFREMGIKLSEGGDDLNEVFESMGLNLEQIRASVAAGDETFGDYSATIAQGLLDIDDELERNAAGVAIYGTKWEDVGGDVFIAASLATEGIEGVVGAADQAQEAMQEGFGPAMERLKRSTIENLSPLGDTAGELLAKMTPFLEKATVWLGDKIPIAVEFLQNKWEIFWPRARDGLVDFWTNIQPALIWVRDMFQSFTTNLLPGLTDAWATLKAGWQPIVDIWNDALKPAFAQLSEALGFAEGDTGEMADTLGLLAGGLAQILAQGLIDGITAGVQLLTIGLVAAKNAANWFKDVFGRVEAGLWGVQQALKWVRDWIEAVKSSFDGLSLPDWLQPGSPTPLELGLLGINKALSAMPDIGGTFNVNGNAPLLGQSQTAPGVSGMTIEQHNHFGADSVRSDEDITRLADQITDALQLRGAPVAL